MTARFCPTLNNHSNDGWVWVEKPLSWLKIFQTVSNNLTAEISHWLKSKSGMMANCGPQVRAPPEPCSLVLRACPSLHRLKDTLKTNWRRGAYEQPFLVQCLQLHVEVTELDQSPKGHSELNQLGNGENFQVEGVPW